jgi:hypothetical protein
MMNNTAPRRFPYARGDTTATGEYTGRGEKFQRVT